METTPYDHEQFGLDLLREVLPDRSPYRAWANFEFIAESGHVYEVDCLVVTSKGLFLVELKHYHGKLEGNTQKWYRPTSGPRSRVEKNPYLLANKKAKLLQSALRQHVGRDVRLPYISALVFLSNADQQVELQGTAAAGIVGPVGASWVGNNRIPSIHDALADEQFPIGGSHRIYSSMELAAAVNAFEKLGIKANDGRKTVGDYVLGKTLEHGDIYQDYRAEHRRFPERRRRVRLFPNAMVSDNEQRTASARAAEREFTLFAKQSHPGIERPVEHADHKLGPALLFEYDEDAVPLDQWLRLNEAELSVSMRLRVFRDVAETLAHAHADRIFHRALNPKAIWVSGPADSPRLRIRDWHFGVRADLADGHTHLPTSATSLAASISSDGSAVDRYRSPELRHSPNAAPRSGDIFSLGALGYLILSGIDPAASPGELDQVLLDDDGLSLDGVVDGVSSDLRMLIWQATQKNPADRFATIEELLGELNVIEAASKVDDVAVMDSVDEEIDPLEARMGDTLSERFEVVARLGKGATAVALLVKDEEANQAERVLKVATSPDVEGQLRDEAAALERLSHPQIVRLLSDPLVVGGRQTLLLTRAGEETLAQRLATEGTAGEFLERWGIDLLSAVAHLEDVGIAHRDLKPANIGIAEQGKNKERHLVIFDFSLTKAADSEIGVGTTGFVDPFLRVDGRNRWDSYAERFAAAVVMYQMATGDLPTWGAGNPDPLMVDNDVQLDPSRFDAAYAEALVHFFGVALARDVADRYGNAETMSAAWAECFVEGPATASEDVATTPDAVITLASPVHELVLSKKALSTLERSAVYTVAELLALNQMTLNRMRGVGKKTVAEIRELTVQLRARFPVVAEPVVPSEAGHISVDRLMRDLLAVAEEEREYDIVSSHLGLDVPDGPLPNQSGVARRCKTNQGTVSSTLIDIRRVWAPLVSAVAARDAVAELIGRRGGVATLDQVARDLLAKFGSSAPSEERTARGRAAARALFDIEADQAEPRWLMRRKGDVLLAALISDDAAFEPEAALSWAAKLGGLADTLADRDVPLAQTAVVSELRRLNAPAGLIVNDNALVSLAASASAVARVSARRELYVSGMSPDAAIRRSVGSLLGVDPLTEKELGDRIRARFPDAADLPPAEELTPILDALNLSLEWNPTVRAWNRRDRSSHFTSHSATSTALAGEDEAGTFAQRLDAAHDSGRLLVMSSPLRSERYRRALRALSSADVTTVDIDQLIVEQLRAKAEQFNVEWSVVLEADASPSGSDDASNFNSLVESVFAGVEAQLASTTGTLLLHNLGLLARYDRMPLVEKLGTTMLFDQSSRRSLWVLLPSEGSAQGPTLDGVGIGTKGPSEFATIPYSWIDQQENVA